MNEQPLLVQQGLLGRSGLQVIPVPAVQRDAERRLTLIGIGGTPDYLSLQAISFLLFVEEVQRAALLILAVTAG